jgi:hypothetical protein
MINFTPAALALAETMTSDEAAHILTWTDEPELLAAPGQSAPVYTPDQITAARMVGEWDVARCIGHVQ